MKAPYTKIVSASLDGSIGIKSGEITMEQLRKCALSVGIEESSKTRPQIESISHTTSEKVYK